jgi:hypothetical protein
MPLIPAPPCSFRHRLFRAKRTRQPSGGGSHLPESGFGHAPAPHNKQSGTGILPVTLKAKASA